jgi:hypothetical protein
MNFTLGTLQLLQFILDQQQLNAGAPDFEDVALKLIAAKREVTAAIAAAQRPV